MRHPKHKFRQIDKKITSYITGPVHLPISLLTPSSIEEASDMEGMESKLSVDGAGVTLTEDIEIEIHF